MDRTQELRRHIEPGSRGIEIGPYHNPITPRVEGFRSIYLDVFDKATLVQRAKDDPLLTDDDAASVVTVDLVGSAVDIAQLVTAGYGDEQFDYVVSSHNLEHLPDPIKFLQGCQQVLRVGGVVSMALPDHRYCFDFFRTRTELGEWLQAFLEHRSRPSPGQLFSWVSLASHLGDQQTWNSQERELPTPWELLDPAYQYWTKAQSDHDSDYQDAHCWVFTPSSLKLLIEDLRYLGFHEFDVVSISPTHGCEFFVHLRKSDQPVQDREAYPARRAVTIRDMFMEAKASSEQFDAEPSALLAEHAAVTAPPPPEFPWRRRVGRLLRRLPRVKAFLKSKLG